MNGNTIISIRPVNSRNQELNKFKNYNTKTKIFYLIVKNNGYILILLNPTKKNNMNKVSNF